MLLSAQERLAASKIASAVDMPQASIGRNLIAHQPLQLPNFRKSSLIFTGPDLRAGEADFENAAAPRNESYPANLIFEGLQ